MSDDGLGIGILLDHGYAEALLRTPRSVDWLEVVPEQWAVAGGRQRWLFDACAERWPMIPHCASLSIGDAEPFDSELLDQVASMVRKLKAPWWSEHAAFCRAGGSWLGVHLPLPFSMECADHVAARVREAERSVGVPVLLENIAWSAAMPGSDLDEAGFLLAVLQRGECGLLLDIAALISNADNHGYDPRVLIDTVTPDRLQQIHLGGHVEREGHMWPSGTGPVADDVWDLYAHALARAGRLVATAVVCGSTPRDMELALDDVERARALSRWALASRTDSLPVSC